MAKSVQMMRSAWRQSRWHWWPWGTPPSVGCASLTRYATRYLRRHGVRR